ncbi:MAG TPA: biotin carboxylase, partial [Anaerolineae bacterium]|nr:biotin carboxylase [Anaerolineae bacterium]
DFAAGSYNTEFLRRPMLYSTPDAPDEVLRDLAVAAAIAYALRTQGRQPVMPAQFLQGWHRSSRQLPG